MSEKSTTNSDKEPIDRQAAIAEETNVPAPAGVTNSLDTKSKGRAVLQWFAVVAGVLVVLIVIGLVSGRLYAGFKHGTDRVTVGPALCGETSVNQFNKLIRQDVPQFTGLKAFVAKLEQQPVARQDATCAYMVFYYYQATGNITKAKQYYTTVTNLNKQGHYPNNKIGDLMNLTIMNDTIQVLQSKQTNPTNSGKALGSG